MTEEYAPKINTHLEAECVECKKQGCSCKAEPLDFSLDESEEDWFSGLTCNPDAPEECESCQ